MPKQYEDNVASSNEVKKIVSDEVRPLLDRLRSEERRVGKECRL